MPLPAQLAKIRQEIDYNLADFQAIVQEPTFVEYFEALAGDKVKGVPRGYKSDNPALPYLQHKGFLALHKFTDDEVVAKDFDTKVINNIKAMKPLHDFLNNAL